MFTKKISQSPTTITDEAIALRAYKIWQDRGCPESDGNDDWQDAKAQLSSEAEQARRPFSRLLARFRNRAAL